MNIIPWLLAVGTARHYAWSIFPDELAGMASKGLGGAAILALLYTVWKLAPKSRALAALLLWWAWEESQVAICSALYILKPWEVAPGQAICSALVGLDMGAIGILAVAIMVLHTVKVTSNKDARNVQK